MVTVSSSVRKAVAVMRFPCGHSEPEASVARRTQAAARLHAAGDCVQHRAHRLGGAGVDGGAGQLGGQFVLHRLNHHLEGLVDAPSTPWSARSMIASGQWFKPTANDACVRSATTSDAGLHCGTCQASTST
jgi:hypothetical protein